MQIHSLCFNTLSRFTLDAIGLAGFDYDFQSIDNPDSEKVSVYNTIMDGFRQPLFFFFPFLDKHMLWAFPQRRQQHKNVQTMTEIYESVIENKRKILAQQKEQHEDPEKDLLTLMIEAGKDDPSQALTNEELRENLSIFFIAGHDTTSNALSFALYYLAVNPDVQEKARKEVIEIMGDGADIVYPSQDQLPEFKYIYMIMKEVKYTNIIHL
jgi:cytochrome P450